jgi:hypothetical protein
MWVNMRIIEVEAIRYDDARVRAYRTEAGHKQISVGVDSAFG